MAQNGFFVIADLAGYTDFLNGSELDHAVVTLRYLFNNILEQIRPPFTVSKLEGDAIFAFAPEGSFIQGQTFIDALDQIYYGYSLAWERLSGNPDCSCNACRLSPRLDLKFAAHYGSFAEQDHGTYVELVGFDVNLVHRLLKNNIPEVTGLRAYAFLTQRCVEELSLGEITETMIPYRETFADVGEVAGFVQDLSLVHQREAEAQKFYIDRENASLSVEFDLPIPPALAWDYLSEPDFQRQWRDDDLMKITGLKKGRMGVGTLLSMSPEVMGTFGSSDELIADWQPTDYMTYRCLIPNANDTKIRHLLMTELTATENGTHVVFRFGTPEAQNPKFTWLVRIAYYVVMKHVARYNLKKMAKLIQSMVEEDIETGKIVPEVFEVSYLQEADAELNLGT